MQVLLFVSQCIYFMLPAYFANIAPVVAKKMRRLNILTIPVDGEKKFNGEPILGSHKTLGGFLLGTVIGIATVYLQLFLFSFSFFRSLSFLDYSKANVFLLGFLLGFGSLVGDAGGSFFKRRFHKNCGEPWIPWDQVSLAFGALIFVLPVFTPSLFIAVSIVAITFLWHLLASKTAYLLRIREEEW